MNIVTVNDFLKHLYGSVTRISWVLQKEENGKTVLSKIDLQEIHKVGNQEFFNKFKDYRVVDFKIGYDLSVVIKKV